MPIIQAQVQIPHDTAVVADAITNVWHFETADVLTTTLEAIDSSLQDFYDSLALNQASRLSSYMSNLLNFSQVRTRMYNLSDPSPRAPIYDDTDSWPGGATSGTPLPHELAVVATFQAAKVSGANQRRRRGRLFLGPFRNTALSAAALDARPSTALQTDIQLALAGMLARSVAAASWEWHVYSPTNNSSVPVTEGWVDNAWDIQRRRGVIATERKTFGG